MKDLVIVLSLILITLAVSISITNTSTSSVIDNVTSFTPIDGLPSMELSQYVLSIADTEKAKSGGNCLPVADLIQQWLRERGHMARIVAVRTGDIGHAVVIYNSDKQPRFNMFIDNGTLSGFIPTAVERIYDGTFGTYLGLCKEVYPDEGVCLIDDYYYM